MSKKNEILKQVGSYALGSQTAQVITLVAAVLSRRLLGPMQMGIWSVLQIIVDYSKYSTLGVTTAMSREIPYNIGRMQKGGADEIKNLTFSFILASSVFLSGAILLFAGLTYGIFRPEISYGLIFIAAIIFLQRMNNLYVALLRSYKCFDLAAKQMVWSAVVNAILVALLTYSFRIYGFMMALVLSFIFNIVFIHWHQRFRFQWQWNTARLGPLIKLGFPLLMVGIIMTILRSLDKIMIARFLGFEALGHYSIAIMVFNFASHFAISVGVVLFPHFQEKFGTRDKNEDLTGYFFQSTSAYACSIPLLIGAAWFSAPFFVQILLPQYLEGVQAMRILSLSLFFMALIEPCHHFLIAIKKHMLLFPFLGGSCTLGVALIFASIRLENGILGVAVSMGVIFFIYFSGVFLLCARILVNWREALGRYTVALISLGYLLLIIYGTQAILGDAPSSLVSTLGSLCVFFLFSSPYLYVLNAKFGLLSTFKRKCIVTN